MRKLSADEFWDTWEKWFCIFQNKSYETECGFCVASNNECCDCDAFDICMKENGLRDLWYKTLDVLESRDLAWQIFMWICEYGDKHGFDVRFKEKKAKKA